MKRNFLINKIFPDCFINILIQKFSCHETIKKFAIVLLVALKTSGFQNFVVIVFVIRRLSKINRGQTFNIKELDEVNDAKGES